MGLDGVKSRTGAHPPCRRGRARGLAGGHLDVVDDDLPLRIDYEVALFSTPNHAVAWPE